MLMLNRYVFIVYHLNLVCYYLTFNIKYEFIMNEISSN